MTARPQPLPGDNGTTDYATIRVPTLGKPGPIRIVDTGRPIWGVMVEQLQLPYCAIAFGGAENGLISIKSGDNIALQRPELNGLYVFLPTQNANLDIGLVITVFFDPVDFRSTRATWDLGQKFQETAEFAGVAGQLAAVMVNNMSQITQQAVLGGNGFSERRSLLDSLTVESSIATRLGFYWTGATGGGQVVTPGVATALPLGFTNLPGGVVCTSGHDAPLGGLALFFHPLVAAGQVLSLSGMDTEIYESQGLLIQAEATGGALRLSARVKVLPVNILAG